MRARPLAVAVVSLICAGCKGHGDPGTAASTAPGPPASTTDADALWAMAPEGTTVALVVSPRALALTEHAWIDLRAFLAAAPSPSPWSP